MNMVNVREDDIFTVHDIKLAIGQNKNTVFFFKEGKYTDTTLEEFVEMTRPIVKYIYNEGFIKLKSLKVTILAK